MMMSVDSFKFVKSAFDLSKAKEAHKWLPRSSFVRTTGHERIADTMACALTPKLYNKKSHFRHSTGLGKMVSESTRYVLSKYLNSQPIS